MMFWIIVGLTFLFVSLSILGFVLMAASPTPERETDDSEWKYDPSDF